MNNNGKTFICDECGKTFDLEPGWNPAKEELDVFGFNAKPEDRAEVCDDCFSKFLMLRNSWDPFFREFIDDICRRMSQ